MPSRRQMAAALSQTGEPKRQRGGRNGSEPVYTEALAEEICDRLATGEPLNAICRDAHMPDEKTVRKWAITRADTFGPMYARARDIGYDSIAEGILEFGKDQAECKGPDGYIDNGEIQRLRMLSDNRRWLLSKLRPKRYGDRIVQEIVGDGDNPLITRIELIPIDVRPNPTIEHESADIDGSDDGSKSSKRRKR